MKTQLHSLIMNAVRNMQNRDLLADDVTIDIYVERTRDPRHGDFASNIAMLLAKRVGTAPRALAEQIVAALPQSELVDRIEIAGPGFINFYLSGTALCQVIEHVLDAGESYGHNTVGQGRLVQVEFVSANPTGPLHVGHGRGAAYGAVVADLLAASGYKVHREYYVNDAGRQMDILTTSVWLRYLLRCGDTITFPSAAYRGSYIQDIADALYAEHGKKFYRPTAAVMAHLPADESDPEQGDREAHIDALIVRTKNLLGGHHFNLVFDKALTTILQDIREDLSEFGVVYENWFHERTLVQSGAVAHAVERLTRAGYIYEQKGARWFRSTEFGDEKDRVIVRENGQPTYFASDIAYHLGKFERRYERIVDIWGADHHGYVPRVKGALAAAGENAARLDVLLVQFANLYRAGQKVSMSTRSGEFVTLRELRQEVGNDAARFFYVMRKCEQHLDFDLDLAKSQSADNPVYYVQYAHARICSVMQQLEEKKLAWDKENALQNLTLLDKSHEVALLTSLSRFPEVVELAAIQYEPHHLANYLRELANDFHTYYNAHPFLVDDAALRDARLALILATRQVLRNGLGLLGVSAPASM